jgi:5-methylcytosine-specific restriction endonuclease McrA
MQLLEKYNKLDSFTQIAKDFNTTIFSVKKRTYRLLDGKLKDHRAPHLNLDFTTKAIELIKQGKLLKELPDILGISYGKMTNLFTKFNIKPTDYYTEEMLVRHKIAPKSGLNKIYTSYQSNAKKNKVKFELTKDQFELLIQGNCHYCGEIPTKESSNKSKFSKIKYNGVDKKYPKKGYILENSVSCCWECNRIKNDIPYDKFIAKCKKIYTLLKNEQY